MTVDKKIREIKSAIISGTKSVKIPQKARSELGGMRGTTTEKTHSKR